MKLQVQYPIGYKPNAQLEAKIKRNLILGYVMFYGTVAILAGIVIAMAFVITSEVLYV